MSFQSQAELIKKSRKAAGLSQGAVAKKLGYSSPQYISNQERSLAGIPEKDLLKYCKVLKISKASVFNALMTDYQSKIRKALDL